MANYEIANRLGKKVATTVSKTVDGKTTIVRYHDTDVVTFDDRWITLDHGGYITPTTKRRMNEASAEFGLGFSVYQKNFKWIVKIGADLLEWIVTDTENNPINGVGNPHRFTFFIRYS